MAPSLYDKVIEELFFRHHEEGLAEFVFDRGEFEEVVVALGLRAPKNLGDVLYSYRFRKPLPSKVRATASGDREWVIELAGRGRYRFRLATTRLIEPASDVDAVCVPDSTPQIIRAYATSDEQALLAIVRYNRLVDMFLGLVAYSLQSHLRTTVPGLGQIEVDELYVGIDGDGNQAIIPVQAKGGTDALGVVQAAQDIALCAARFPELCARPIAAQFLPNDDVVLFELAELEGEVVIVREGHYRLVGVEAARGAATVAKVVDL